MKKIILYASLEREICSFFVYLLLVTGAFLTEPSPGGRDCLKAGKASSGEAQFSDTPPAAFWNSGLSLQRVVTRVSGNLKQ